MAQPTSIAPLDSPSHSALHNFVVDVRMFGAVGDGVTDDSAAILAAFTALPAGGGTVVTPPGTFMGANITLPNKQGMILKSTGGIIKKNANGPIFTTPSAGWGKYLTFDDARLDGNGANFTGVGISVGASSAFMKFLGGYIIDTASYCIDFTVDGAGSQSAVADCLLTVYLGGFGEANAGVACIKLPYDATQAPNRGFVNIVTNACVLYDDYGSQNTRFEACAARTGIMSNANALTPGKFFLVGCRLASVGATVAIRGTQNMVVGNAFAGTLQIEGAAANGVYVANVIAGDLIFAAGTSNNIYSANRCPSPGVTTDNGSNFTGSDIASHVADASDAHDASAVSFIPTGTIAATDVQAAIAELDDGASKLIVKDTRGTEEAPYVDFGHRNAILAELKARADITGTPGAGTFGTLITYAKWSDDTGGGPSQMWIDDSSPVRTFWRHGTVAGGWGAWTEVGVGLRIGNSAAATTPGSVVKKAQVFDASGSSLGYVMIYDGAT